MSTAEGSSANPPGAPKKKTVWPYNLVAALLLGFSLALSSRDSVTRAITTLCLSISLAACYFSLRSRFSLLGGILLIVAIYCYAAFLLFTPKA